MIRQKVRIPCGLFDLVSPSYGRPRFITEGLAVGPSGRVDYPERGIGQSAELAALDERRALRKAISAHNRQTPLAGPRLRDNRPVRFINRAHWA